MVHTKARRSYLRRQENLGHDDAGQGKLAPGLQMEETPFQLPTGRGETIIFDDGKINAAVVDRARVQTHDLARIEQDIRKGLCGRPIQFKLAEETNGLVVSAVVPTFYSKQLLLRAVQQASFPTAVLDRICVPYPTRRTP